MKITVTQADIDQGQPCNTYACALTLAIRRATGNPNARMVAIDARIVDLPDGKGVYVAVPPEAIEFRRNFDQYLPVQPFEFELDFPPLPTAWQYAR